MAAITWFLVNGVDGNGWQQLSTTAQSLQTCNAGWVVGTGSTNHSELAANTERASTTFTGTTVPDGTLDTSLKDAIRSPDALSGDFASANWTFQFGVRATVQGGQQDGRVRFRIIKADADGSNPTEITSGQQQASIASNVPTASDVNSSLTVNPGAFSISNQYVFIQVAWERTGAGGMTTSNIRFRAGAGTGSTSGTFITTSDFSTGSTPTRGRVSWAELETPAVATRGRISFAELETPFVATRGRVSWAELETPLVPTRGRVSFTELEVPALPTRGRISFAELEVPNLVVATRGRVSFAELEVPLVPTRGRVSFAELETPLAPTRGRISWADFSPALFPVLTSSGTVTSTVSYKTSGPVLASSLEFAATAGRISWAELETPLAPTRGRVSFAELQVPDVGVTPTRGLISFTEFETPLVATRGRLSFAELEVPLVPTRGRMSWTELETPFVQTRGRLSFAELETGFTPTRGRISWAEAEFPLAPTRGRMSWAELELPAAPTRGRISFAELQVPDLGAPTRRGYVPWLSVILH